MTDPVFAVERIDTWVFNVGIAIPVVCVIGLIVWHFVSSMTAKRAKNRKAVRSAPEPPEPFAFAHRRPSSSLLAPDSSPAPPATTEGIQTESTSPARAFPASAREDTNDLRSAGFLDPWQALARILSDIPAGAAGHERAALLLSDPARLQRACDAAAELLAELSLELSESWSRQGQHQQAAAVLQRLVRSCPETRQAEVARERLRHLGLSDEMIR